MDWQSVLYTTWMVVFVPTYFLMRLLWWPFTTLYRFTLTLFSPVIYTLRVLVSPFFYLYNSLPRLQPLYIFFGSAAFLGVMAGVGVLFTSTVIASVTGMRNGETNSHERRQLSSKRDRSTSPDTGTPTGIKRLDEPYSSQESDWQWLEKTPGPGDSRRRQKPGLLAQTILEEEDDS
ncbi:hypothetical protein DL546_004337 [Coniochaeta pulveracea]|uniref:Uncharacterized protein n=1 Tax=Coniochaeta pulveracea TaxID=177199 RepID=A0A420YDG4_9PEZI|nr:hypothetical protein DL546_004337 [Coniochaeta pulveracea]